MSFKQLSSGHLISLVGQTAFGAQQRATQSLLLPLNGREWSVQGLVLHYDTINSESVLSIKSGHCSVVIGYQIDAFSHTWSAECFIVWSHINPWFTGKLSAVTHVLLELTSEYYFFQTKLSKTLSKVYIPSSQILSKLQICIHTLIGMMPLLLWSFQGS